MNILFQTGRKLETSSVNEWFLSAVDLLFVSLASCFCGDPLRIYVQMIQAQNTKTGTDSNVTYTVSTQMYATALC